MYLTHSKQELARLINMWYNEQQKFKYELIKCILTLKYTKKYIVL